MEINNRITKNQYYLKVARAISTRSTCLRRQYGAVIVKDDEIIATGYNGAPRGYPNCCDLGECQRNKLNCAKGSGYEYCPSVHAEQNAMLSASRKEMMGATIYIAGYENDGTFANGCPCNICSRLIVNSGIRYIVYETTKPCYIEVIDVEKQREKISIVKEIDF